MLNCLVLFDAENQQEEITQLKSWAIAKEEFLGFTIKDDPMNYCVKTKLLEVDLVIILIGESTRFLGNAFNKAVKEILSTDISILCLNVNGFVALEENTCPNMLANAGCVHMPFTKESLALSLNYIKLNSRAENKIGSFHFKNYTPNPFSE